MRLLRLLFVFLRIGVMGEMAYPANFFAHLLDSALELATAHQTAPSGWLAPRLERLAAARDPVGEAELMVVDPVIALACLAAGSEGAAAEGCRPAAAGDAAHAD